MNNAPVFIVGVARSGTSLLYRVLSAHSHFHSRTGASRETKIFKHSVHIRRGLQDERLRLFIGDDEIYKRFIRSVRPVVLLQRPLNRVPRYDVLCARSPLLWSAVGGKYVVRQFFIHAALARSADRIVEKTPAHLHFTNHIYHAFSDAKVLMMVRHPVDVLTSYRRRLQDEFKAGNGYREWLDVSLGDFVHRFRQDVRAILNQLKATKAVKLVRYEDFICDPQSSFHSICSFLDLPFENSPLHTSRPGAEVPHDPYLNKSITEDTKDWRDYMSSAEAKWIEQKLEPLMSAIGYAPKVSA